MGKSISLKPGWDEKEPDKNGSRRSFHLSQPLRGEAVEIHANFTSRLNAPARLAPRSNKRQLIHAGLNVPHRPKDYRRKLAPPCCHFGITNFPPPPFLPRIFLREGNATRLSLSLSRSRLIRRRV